jgi:Na+/H+ antiporter NhaA
MMAIFFFVVDLEIKRKLKAFTGLGFLGGIGSKMSLSISSLAFETRELLNQAKIGIFFGSIATKVY